MKCKMSRTQCAPRYTVLARCLGAALATSAAGSAGAHVAAPPLPAAEGLAIAAPPAIDTDRMSELVQRAVRTIPALPADTVAVSNCNDAGAGSLRAAVSAASSGDTIDLSSLPCSKITLTTGAIAISQDDLTLQGPGALGLEISGNDTDRVFWHLGSGTLKVNDVTLTHGHKYLDDGGLGNAAGGCVFSSGTAAMNHTLSKYCDVGSNSASAVARGGAIYAAAGVTLMNSIVTMNKVHSTVFEARGGGVYTPGDLYAGNSSIFSNSATGQVSTGGGVQVGSRRDSGADGGSAIFKYSTVADNSAGMFGGGVYVTGNATVLRSTLSGNTACRAGGVYFVGSGSATQPVSFRGSTVSGNTAYCGDGAAGIALWNRDGKIFDSTIAFNRTINHGSTKYGAGVRMPNGNSLELENTIIASNAIDTGSETKPDDIGGGGTVTGAQNLVYFPSSMTMPGGTILLTDPMLRPLANNGGSTSTHMPNFGSPVIDAGNNASGDSVDQRGTGYPRIRGATADIGSVEFNLADVIFRNGFD